MADDILRMNFFAIFELQVSYQSRHIGMVELRHYAKPKPLSDIHPNSMIELTIHKKHKVILTTPSGNYEL